MLRDVLLSADATATTHDVAMIAGDADEDETTVVATAEANVRRAVQRRQRGGGKARCDGIEV